ncbi:hypothetical protein SDC9_69933 [bioreactor metagenome]|uniref:Uncharacterized protein n=1 Tax=bioreactor metagenome TaxID=1076179 RepID=A0A644Y4N9_9ZZZZ
MFYRYILILHSFSLIFRFSQYFVHVGSNVNFSALTAGAGNFRNSLYNSIYAFFKDILIYVHFSKKLSDKAVFLTCESV